MEIVYGREPLFAGERGKTLAHPFLCIVAADYSLSDLAIVSEHRQVFELERCVSHGFALRMALPLVTMAKPSANSTRIELKRGDAGRPKPGSANVPGAALLRALTAQS
ncbi:hypothetical protein [Mesorhizobium sp.]|uniref:hypothetical protein n=1 Tax=Mesorhizobium sp. TaxID=1871066 RepID=UPI000FE5911F|nr:hypothetical protein [Mesorhizobium sp.]RWE71863.1 MAG: hypothetical protein EOS42_25155 [Mesorhizobium sp.]